MLLASWSTQWLYSGSKRNVKQNTYAAVDATGIILCRDISGR